MPRLSAEIEAKSSLGFEIGFGAQQIEIDCQNDVQNASKTAWFSTLNYPITQNTEACRIKKRWPGNQLYSLQVCAINKLVGNPGISHSDFLIQIPGSRVISI